MIKANKKTLIISSIMAVLPIFVGIYLWDQLPDVMATHFSLNGKANGFSSKPFGVFGVPTICIVTLWFHAIVTSKSPRKQNISSKTFCIPLWIYSFACLFATAIIYLYNLGIKLDIVFFTMLFVGFLLILVGNYLPKVKQNYVIGIRTPWTLTNEDNWNRTHRFAGFLWIIAGIIIVLNVLSGIMNTIWFILPLIIAVPIPFIYSFVLHISKEH